MCDSNSAELQNVIDQINEFIQIAQHTQMPPESFVEMHDLLDEELEKVIA